MMTITCSPKQIVVSRRHGPPVKGRIEQIEPSGLDLVVVLSSVQCRPLKMIEISGILDLDTGEIVEGEDVETWLWRELLSEEVQRHGGIRLEIAIVALPIRNLGPYCAAAIARHFRTLDAFLNCVNRAAEELKTFSPHSDTVVQETLLRDRYEMIKYGFHDGIFAQEQDQSQINKFDSMLELMQPPGIGIARMLAIIEALLTGKIAHVLSTTLAGQSILHYYDNLSTDSMRPLYQENVVFTGTLDVLTRAAAKDAAEGQGASVSKSITSSTTLVVAGKKPSQTKISKADELHIRVISESEFLELISVTNQSPE